MPILSSYKTKIYSLLSIIIFGFLFTAALAPLPAQAQTQINWQTELTETAKTSYDTTKDPNLTQTIGQVIKIVLSFLGVILLLLIIYGGFLWMTSGGEEEKVGKAKKIIGSAAVGVLIIIVAYTLTYFIIDQLITASNPSV